MSKYYSITITTHIVTFIALLAFLAAQVVAEEIGTVFTFSSDSHLRLQEPAEAEATGDELANALSIGKNANSTGNSKTKRLIAALKDKYSWVRRNAATSLGQLAEKGIDASSAVEPLIAALKDKSISVRRSATTSLGQIGIIKALPYLKQRLKGRRKTREKDPEVINAIKAAIKLIEDTVSHIPDSALSQARLLQHPSVNERSLTQEKDMPKTGKDKLREKYRQTEDGRLERVIESSQPQDEKSKEEEQLQPSIEDNAPIDESEQTPDRLAESVEEQPKELQPQSVKADALGKPNISQAQEIGFIEALQRAKQINTKRAAVIIGDITSVAIPTKAIEIYRYTAKQEDEAKKKKADLEIDGYDVLLINTTNNTSQLTNLPAVTITSDVKQALNTFLERDV